MFDITHEEIISEFKKTCPWIYKEAIKWKPIDKFKILVELSNGSVFSYDYISKTIRGARSRSEWYEKLNPRNEYEWRKLFAANLYRKMTILGYTQEDISKLANISTATMSRYLNGDSSPNGWNIYKIAKVLKCSETDLMQFV